MSLVFMKHSTKRLAAYTQLHISVTPVSPSPRLCNACAVILPFGH